MSLKSIALLTLAASTTVTAVPIIPDVWTADITATTNGTLPNVPKGTKSFTEYHDFKNKRRRVDFKDQYYTKIYRYDVKSFDHNPFPASKGYQMHLDSSGNPNPNSCCWLWLVDEDGNDDRMFALQVDKNAKDAGKTSTGLEEWTSASTFPFPTTDSFYFNNETDLSKYNSYASVLGKGTIISNTTYTNWKTGPIDNATFAVPSSKPTFGKCKQFGVDPSCPMPHYEGAW